ncbi:Thioredoxin F-type, chloroplastic [Capsicum baccatum]|uniref:Thioredoxin F-type, chloroplastic n=1 Tax=Capsicum baccatum TaxID=33114 RepID=A0A2G2V655_CAPBA|nr:Thioredoxin F-type, chloroplastic [Capsicum baccatum]
MTILVISHLNSFSSTFKSSAISLSHTHSTLPTLSLSTTFSLYLYIHTANLFIQQKMALQVQVNQVPLKSSSSSTAPLTSPWRFSKRTVVCVAGDYGFSPKVLRNRELSLLKVKCSSSDATATAVTATVGQVTEVCKDTFWPIVEAAGDKTVVLDMYTQWCGPCKVIAPKFKDLSQKYNDVVFLKLDCNQDNRPLAKELGIKVVPTFKILKHNKIVKEVTGAKLDDLVAAIEGVRSS